MEGLRADWSTPVPPGTTLDVSGTPRAMSAEATVALRRTAQEGLANAAKHAPGASASVQLVFGPGEVILTVTDTGGTPNGRARSAGPHRGWLRDRGAAGTGRAARRDTDGRPPGGRVAGHAPGSRGDQGHRDPGSRVVNDEASLLRIVVADDQRAVREALATVLDAEPGFEVVGLAADGGEAVELAHRFSPAVVLMDLRMPTVDGVAATGPVVQRTARDGGAWSLPRRRRRQCPGGARDRGLGVLDQGRRAGADRSGRPLGRRRPVRPGSGRPGQSPPRRASSSGSGARGGGGRGARSGCRRPTT